MRTVEVERFVRAKSGVVDRALDPVSIVEYEGSFDVFETEPLPEDSPLWEMDDVIVTPHVAAATSAYYRRIATLVKENLRRFEQEAALTNRVV